jgi:hypothetical protein
MTQTAQIAKHLRDVHFGGNWTWSNLKDNLADVSWEEATKKIDSFNTIAALTFHVNYFVVAVLDVLQNKPLTSHDKFSFDVPPIHSKEDWDRLVNKALTEAEQCAALIEQLPDSKLDEMFVEEKYGNYFRNFHGLIEHTHYHLGQIAILKKLVKK